MDSLNGWIESGCGHFPCAGRHVAQQLTGWQSIAPLVASLLSESHSHGKCWVPVQRMLGGRKAWPGGTKAPARDSSGHKEAGYGAP